MLIMMKQPAAVKQSASFNGRGPRTPDLTDKPGKPKVQVPATATDDCASPGGGKRTPKKIDVLGEQTDGAKLAADLKVKAKAIPEEAQQWAQVSGAWCTCMHG